MKRVFISYAREDEVRYLRPLRTRLEPLERAGRIELWHDRELLPGQDFDRAIVQKLNEADIVLLLVSSDFIRSDYAFGIEMTCALARHERSQARAVPVIVRGCDWERLPFAKLNALPIDGRPVEECEDQSAALDEVVQGVERIVAELEGPAPVGATKPSASRYHLYMMARRQHAALQAVGVRRKEPLVDEPADVLRLYAMTPIDNSNVLIDAFPVSETDYFDFCEDAGRPLPPYLIQAEPRADYPVVFVRAHDVDDFAAWAGKRLPTLAEWNRMAFGLGGGRYSRYPWGEEFDPRNANTPESEIGRVTAFTAHPRGRTLNNAFDAVGNTWDWVSDEEDGERLAVGGSFFDSGRMYCRRGKHIRWIPGDLVQDIGFRCALDR